MEGRLVMLPERISARSRRRLTAHAYQLVLSSGTITATGQPTAAPHRLSGPVSDR